MMPMGAVKNKDNGQRRCMIPANRKKKATFPILISVKVWRDAGDLVS